jgi:predicted NBD/HSP70 family sugar kinase
MDAWRDLDVRRLVEEACGYPVLLENDATAACGAELVFGTGAAPRDFLYFYVGYFIGGGLVLDHRLFVGRTGNAAALGSMPVPVRDRQGGSSVAQLIDVASLSCLDARLAAAGQDGSSLWAAPDEWTVDRAMLADWTTEAGDGIAHAIAAAAAVVDVEAALIDGWMPADVRAALVRHTGLALARMNLAGIRPPEVRAGSVGPDARVLGAASLPLSERFLVRGDTLSPAADGPLR